MKPVLRFQSQLLFRKSYKPDRLIRIRLAARTIKVFRPARAGLKSAESRTRAIADVAFPD